MDLKKVASKHLEALLKEVGVELLFPALKAAVEKSATKFDDMAFAALEPTIKEEFIKLVDKIYVEAA